MATFTIEQYNTLIAAIAEGVTTVQYSDKSVTYRSFDDMLRLKRMMEIDLGITGAKTTKYAQHYRDL